MSSPHGAYCYYKQSFVTLKINHIKKPKPEKSLRQNMAHHHPIKLIDPHHLLLLLQTTDPYYDDNRDPKTVPSLSLNTRVTLTPLPTWVHSKPCRNPAHISTSFSL